MECQKCLENISALIDRELDSSLQQQLEEHLLICENCQRVANSLKLLSSSLVQANEPISIPKNLEDRIIFSIEKEKKKVKKQLALTAFILVLMAAPFILFSSFLWPFIHIVYAAGSIVGQAESVLLQLIPSTTSWSIGIIALVFIAGGIVLVRAMWRGFRFNEVLSRETA